MWKFQNTDELYHHGILGMKWGIRRYQYADGSLTPEGRKRAAKLKAKYDYLTKGIKKKKSNSKSKSSRQKPIKEMTDEELRSKTNRMTLEANYLDAAKRIGSFSTKEISKGRAFAKKVVSDVIGPAVWDASKQVTKSYIVKMLNDSLDLEGDYKIYTNNKKKN